MEKPTLAVITRLSRPAEFLGRLYRGLERQKNVDIYWSIVSQIPITSAHDHIFETARSKGIKVTITSAKGDTPLGELANIGIRAVSSEFIILHDDDDQILAGFFEQGILHLQTQNAKAVACHAAIIRESDIDSRKALEFVGSPGREFVDSNLLKVHNLIYTNGLIYRRDAYERVGGYSEDVKVGEDWMFNLALVQNNPISIIPKVYALVFVRKSKPFDHNDNRSNTVVREHEAHVKIQKLVREKYVLKHDEYDAQRPFNNQFQRWVDRSIYFLTRQFLPRF